MSDTPAVLAKNPKIVLSDSKELVMPDLHMDRIFDAVDLVKKLVEKSNETGTKVLTKLWKLAKDRQSATGVLESPDNNQFLGELVMGLMVDSRKEFYALLSAFAGQDPKTFEKELSLKVTKQILVGVIVHPDWSDFLAGWGELEQSPLGKLIWEPLQDLSAKASASFKKNSTSQTSSSESSDGEATLKNSTPLPSSEAKTPETTRN